MRENPPDQLQALLNDDAVETIDVAGHDAVFIEYVAVAVGAGPCRWGAQVLPDA